MTCKVEYHPDLKLVECVVEGFLTVNELLEATIATVSLSVEKETNLILVDDSKLEKTVETVDIYELPQSYEDLNIDRKIKAAVILPISLQAREDVQFYETVCQNRGWDIAVFEQRQEAIDWLMEESG